MKPKNRLLELIFLVLPLILFILLINVNAGDWMRYSFIKGFLPGFIIFFFMDVYVYYKRKQFFIGEN